MIFCKCVLLCMLGFRHCLFTFFRTYDRGLSSPNISGRFLVSDFSYCDGFHITYHFRQHFLTSSAWRSVSLTLYNGHAFGPWTPPWRHWLIRMYSRMNVLMLRLEVIYSLLLCSWAITNISLHLFIGWLSFLLLWNLITYDCYSEVDILRLLWCIRSIAIVKWASIKCCLTIDFGVCKRKLLVWEIIDAFAPFTENVGFFSFGGSCSNICCLTDFLIVLHI